MVFLAFYLLIGNVMLLNLLIAIFTSVFEEVQVNSNEVWKWEMYRLVHEYDSRPGLAPPFTLIEDLFHLLKIQRLRGVRGSATKVEVLQQHQAFVLETLPFVRLTSIGAFFLNVGLERLT